MLFISVCDKIGFPNFVARKFDQNLGLKKLSPFYYVIISLTAIMYRSKFIELDKLYQMPSLFLPIIPYFLRKAN